MEELRTTDLFRKSTQFTVEPFKSHGYFASVDALEFSRALQSESADVIFIDPPFNLGKKYQRRNRVEELKPDAYFAYLSTLLRDQARVLKPGGALFLYHLPIWASKFAGVLHEELTFRHWIAVMMKNGFVRGDNLYPAHYALLYFSKGKPKYFRRPRLKPAVCRHCGKLVKSYGGYTAIIEKNGINLSDFWDDLSPVRHKIHKHRSANQLPQKLTDRVISIAGAKGKILVDPFVGTGTMLVSAMELGMQFVANDVSKRSLATARRRLSEIASP